MKDSTVLERFITAAPLCVLTRCILGHLMTDGLDDVFDHCRQRQYEGTIQFSALAASVADVALGFCANFNQAYHHHKDQLAASVVAYYGKLNRVEPSIAEGVVQFAGRQAAELLQALGDSPPDRLPGYRCSVLDGNHLRQSEKRLGALRGLSAAALPGTVVAKWNLDTQLFERAYLLEDAHAQESTVLDHVVADLQAQEVLIADRHFCIVAFLRDVAAAGSSFVIRQHGRLKGELVGERQAVGRSDTGMVYEQDLRLHDSDGQNLTVRRITVELDTPTRDGDPAIHLLTNLPRAQVRADRVAQLYRERWDIEYGFYVVTMTLTCELRSIGHPRAALFLFCMALLADNARQVLYAALRTAHAAAEVEALSELAVARQIVQPMAGLVTALPESEWDRQVERTLAGRAAFLRRVSRHVPVRAYRKSVRGPKRPRPPRQPFEACRHVSTYRLLKAQKKKMLKALALLSRPRGQTAQESRPTKVRTNRGRLLRSKLRRRLVMSFPMSWLRALILLVGAAIALVLGVGVGVEWGALVAALFGWLVAGASLIALWAGRHKDIAIRIPNTTWQALVCGTLVAGLIVAFVSWDELLIMPGYGKYGRTESDVQTLAKAAEGFGIQFSAYPETLEAMLHPPTGKPYLTSPDDLTDPWGRPYQYDPDGALNQGKRPDVWTITPDGEVIGNWMVKKK